MTPNPPANVSESDTIARLETEIAVHTAERDECVRRTRELMAAEDPESGVFHNEEIFRLQQNKLRLEVEVELRRKKINRIRLGYGEDAPVESAGGLLF